jgi:hypothetical protein
MLYEIIGGFFCVLNAGLNRGQNRKHHSEKLMIFNKNAIVFSISSRSWGGLSWRAKFMDTPWNGASRNGNNPASAQMRIIPGLKAEAYANNFQFISRPKGEVIHLHLVA